MSGLESVAAYAASAVLAAVTVIPFGYYCGSGFRMGSRVQPQAGRMANVFLCIAPLLYMIGASMYAARPAQIAYSMSRRKPTYYNEQALLYLAVGAQFAVTMGAILATMAVYLCALSVLYMVLGKQKWWKYLRLDALCGSVLLLTITIVWFVRSMVLFTSRNSESTWRWLLLVVDATLCLLAAGILGTAVYVTPKLKRKPTHLATRRFPALLLSASFLWLLRCTYVFAADLKSDIWGWADDELAAQKIILPILEFWVSVTVIGLVAAIMRSPAWDDPACNPSRFAEQHRSQVFVQGTEYYPQAQYGYQQQPPRGYQY